MNIAELFKRNTEIVAVYTRSPYTNLKPKRGLHYSYHTLKHIIELFETGENIIYPHKKINFGCFTREEFIKENEKIINENLPKTFKEDFLKSKKNFVIFYDDFYYFTNSKNSLKAFLKYRIKEYLSDLYFKRMRITEKD